MTLIEHWAERTAISIKKMNPEQTTSVEIMKFALLIWINGLSVTIMCLMVGAFTGKFEETALVLVAFGTLRFVSGGYHFNSALQCIIASTLLLSTLPHVALSHNWNLGLLITSLILLAIFAPSNIINQTRIPEKYFPFLKICSIILVLANFAFFSDIVTATFFVQAVTTIYLRR